MSSPRTAKSPRVKLAKKLAHGDFPKHVSYTGGNRTVPMPLPAKVHIEEETEENIRRARSAKIDLYKLIDNGGISFLAFFDKFAQKLAIYRYVGNIYEDETIYEKVKVFKGVDKIFAGKSQAGKIAEKEWAGEKYTGNTILFSHNGGKKYIVFEKEFKEFTPKAEIKSFASPIGNNGVPYPYAVDEAGNLYFFASDLVVSNSSRDYKNLLQEEWKFFFDSKTEIEGKEKTKLATKVVIRR